MSSEQIVSCHSKVAIYVDLSLSTFTKVKKNLKPRKVRQSFERADVVTALKKKKFNRFSSYCLILLDIKSRGHTVRDVAIPTAAQWCHRLAKIC